MNSIYKPKNRRSLKIWSAITGLFLMFGSLAACSSEDGDLNGGNSQMDGLVISVTTSILGDVVENIVGNAGTVHVLMPAGSDPHNYQLSTKDISKMMSSDLIIENGLGLEEGLAASLKSAKSDGLEILTVGEFIDPLPSSTYYGTSEDDDAHEHDDDESADHDHDHGPLDPHFWHDPLRMVIAVEAIKDHLIKLPGIDTEKVELQAKEYTQKLHSMNADLAETYAAIPKERRLLVTGHRVFIYLANQYDFEIVGSIVPSSSTLAETSASELMLVAETLKELGINAVFTDASQSQKSAETVVKETGLDITIVPLYSESLTPPGGEADTYIELMVTNSEKIFDALS